MRSWFGRLVTTSLIGGALVALAPDAHAADVRLTVDWGRLLAKGWAWATAEAEAEKAPRQIETSHATQTTQGAPQLGSAWFGAAPQVSLVARDWGSARSLVGGPMTLTDAVRVSRSSRMVLSRMRLGQGRVVPFAQVGLGQWRVDTDVVAHLPRSVEIAAQFGGGFEARLARGWDLAVEVDHTVLCREGMHDPQQVVAPHMWGTFLASRAVF